MDDTKTFEISDDIIIDNKTYKIMKYLYNKHGVLFSTIEAKFGSDNACALFGLCRAGYAAHILPNGILTQDVSVISKGSKFALMTPGNKRVEEIREAKLLRRLPILLSAVSVLTSLVALIISILTSNSEIFVHVLS